MDRKRTMAALGLQEGASDEDALAMLAATVEKARRADVAEAGLRQATANKEIDAKVMAGKMRTSERTFGMRLLAADPQLFREWLDEHQAPLINLSGSDGPTTSRAAVGPQRVTGPSAEELTVCKAMGIDVEKYRAFKASNGPVRMAPADDEETEDEANP